MQLSLLGAPPEPPLPLPALRRAEPCTVSLVTDRRAFDALADQWRVIEATARGAVLFQSYDWCRAVWDHWLRKARPFEPRILIARRGSETVGILPLRIVRRGPLRIATGLAEPFQQYSDAILSPDQGHDVVDALLGAALRLDACDGIELLKVRDDSPLAGALASNGAVRAAEDAAPYIDLRGFKEFADYHATVKPKTRKNIRNSRNRITRMHRLEHRVITCREDIRVLVARTYRGRERWLKELGLTSRAFREDTFPDFLDELASGGHGLSVLAMSLEADGRPIADQWGVVFNGRYYAYGATWDPLYEEFSPGKLHLEDVIRACHELEIGTADFLMPAAHYKLTWTDDVMPVADFALPCSWRGRIYASCWIGALRPQLKRLALATPDRARSLLATLIFARRGVPSSETARLPASPENPTGCGRPI